MYSKKSTNIDYSKETICESILVLVCKVVLFLTIPALLIPPITQAAQVNFNWRANPSGDNVLGYKLYFGKKTACGDSSFCQFGGQSFTQGFSPTDILVTDLSNPNNPSYNLDGLDEGDWCFRLTAYNEIGESNPTSPLTIAIDTIPPSVSFTAPTTAPSFTTTNSTINIAGEASDNLCLDSVTWTSSTGGSGTASGTTSWSQENILLQEGNNLLTVTVIDSAGNTAEVSLTVTYTPPPPDVESPVLTITDPTSLGTYQTGSSTLNIAGTAADDVEVARVTWTNDRGGSGTASGTTNWSIANIILSEGDNIITVTATDTSDNSSSDTLTVSFTLPPGTHTAEFGEATASDYPGTGLDTSINAGAASTGSSTGVSLYTYTWPTDVSANRIIMQWDLSAIPPSATVQNAILYLYLSAAGSGDEQYEITAHKVINVDPDISRCTWSTYDGVNSWTGGAVGAAQDMGSVVDSEIIDKSVGEYKAWTITNLAADWVAHPSANYGVILDSDNTATSDSHRYFSSSDHTDSNQRPKLIVTYTIGSATDSDGDGVVDSEDNCPNIANPDQADCDGDGSGDACDAVSLCSTDSDGDGVVDSEDNCPNIANPGQADCDGDGSGDACDAVSLCSTDSDGDGVVDSEDNCLDIANPDQADCDGDGSGDACDIASPCSTDSDGDMVVDSDDNCPDTINPDQADADADGYGDACDICTDTDGDGYGNPGYSAQTCTSDNCPDIANGDQADCDGDGIGDVCDIASFCSSIITEEFGNAIDTDHPGTCLDTYINAGAAGTNSSSEVYLNTYTWPTDVSANRIIMKWDLSVIPPSATVQNAILYLYSANTGGDSQYEISAHKIINRNPDINSCTWNTHDGVNPWTGGADGASQDMAPAEDSQIIDEVMGEYKTWSITRMVADWVANPIENYGLLLESDTSAPSDSHRYFSSSDNTDSSQRPKLIITYSSGAISDTTPPTIDGHNPAKGAVDVPIDTNIVFHLQDTGDGVDQSSIVMTVEGAVVSPTSVTGTPADYTITYNPFTDFGYQQVVDVTIDASDLAGNQMARDIYSFTTSSQPDTTPPTIYGNSPVRGAIDIPIDSDIVFHLNDIGDGVDQSSIVMTVEGAVVSPTSVTGTPADYTITYNPFTDFGYQQVVDVTIDASDLAGNAMPQDVYAFTTTNCVDADSDGYCAIIDCDDSNPSIFPGASEDCDGVDNDCDGQTDEDFTNLGTSCTKGLGICQTTGIMVCSADKSGTECNATPGTPAAEICDQLDNNCDGRIDEGCSLCTDNDNDGYSVEGNGCGMVDCDDADASINPGATELCDGIDNNCDYQIDEGCMSCTDNDQDGYAVEGGSCGMVDCDDNHSQINPGAYELCDGIDNNCDYQIDEGCPTCTDNDKDGYSVEGGGCGMVDCDDNNSQINPGATELCDGVDNNCDYQIDEGCSICTDADADGYYAESGCGTMVDCNDSDRRINPGACDIRRDGIDQDCDGTDRNTGKPCGNF